jgi:hypothetical protein
MKKDAERSVTMKLLTGSAVELMIWTAGFVYLAVIDPFHPPLSFCPSVLAGFGTCPGCGLGRSVSLLLHGEPAMSIQEHLLGIPAALVLLFRIGQLARTINQQFHRMNH